MKNIRVCAKDFQKGAYSGQRQDGFPMHPALKQQADIHGDNIINDMDMIALVTGSGRVRIGKSVISNQIGYYHYWRMKHIYKKPVHFSLERNYAFSGEEFVEKAHWLNKHKYNYSPLIYDEAGADIESIKVLTKRTRAIMDYFRECGQYNLFNILVLPEFFKLPDWIAINRSDFLVNCYTSKAKTINPEGNKSYQVKRGYYQFFSGRRKKKLYMLGKKNFNNYASVKGNFSGKWSNCFCLDWNKYNDMKKIALVSRDTSPRKELWLTQRNAILTYVRKEFGKSPTKISEELLNSTGILMPMEAIKNGIHTFSKENRF